MKSILTTAILSTLLFSSYAQAQSSTYYDNFQSTQAAISTDKEFSDAFNKLSKLRPTSEFKNNSAFVTIKKDFILDHDFDLIDNEDLLDPQKLAFLIKATDVDLIESGANFGKYTMNKFIGVIFMGKKIGKNNFINDVTIKINRDVNKIVIYLDMFDHSTLFYDNTTKISFLRLNNGKIKVKTILVASLKRNSMIDNGLCFERWRKNTLEGSTDKEIDTIIKNLNTLLKEKL